MRILIPAALLPGCVLGATGPYTGEVDGLDAAVGLVLDGGQGRLYVAGGPMTRDSHTRWIDIAVEGRGFVGQDDGWVVTSDFFAGSFSGTLTDPGGASWAFGAYPPEAEVDGLYEADEGECLAGAVVWGGGAELLGVLCLPNGLSAPLAPLGEIGLDQGGVRAGAGEGDPFLMSPAVP